MNTFKIHTVDTAPDKSRKTLQAVGENIGFIPKVFATIAESPHALEDEKLQALKYLVHQIVRNRGSVSEADI
jgi:hypothetical protein